MFKKSRGWTKLSCGKQLEKTTSHLPQQFQPSSALVFAS